MNTLVNIQSRQGKDPLEWKFNRTCFSRSAKHLQNRMLKYLHLVTHQVPQCIAWLLDPFSQVTDVMQQNWSKKFTVCVSHFGLTSSVLQNIMADQTEEMILVSPT